MAVEELDLLGAFDDLPELPDLLTVSGSAAWDLNPVPAHSSLPETPDLGNQLVLPADSC